MQDEDRVGRREVARRPPAAGRGPSGREKYEGRISEEDLAEETGLTPDQIEAGVT
ncbi:hypothetical protein [Streptomyces sp. NPDC088789]|uniref:hypothetical protein n=1 Tax=Streptomyces sp. NPDC088789 TaxID=3365899 RepID=UPI00382596AA